MYNPWNELPTPTKSVTSRLFVFTPTDLVVAIPAVYELQVPPAPAPPPWILTSTVVPLTANVFPVPIKFSWVIPAPIWTPPDWIPTSEAPDNVPITLAPVLVVLNLRLPLWYKIVAPPLSPYKKFAPPGFSNISSSLLNYGLNLNLPSSR